MKYKLYWIFFLVSIIIAGLFWLYNNQRIKIGPAIGLFVFIVLVIYLMYLKA